ncbi:MAG: hypothetical protein SF187_02480 [Deltaproteobacteria bacterium]|nr:hypothetical protein [Deltaproteobacteria bacterium]
MRLKGFLSAVGLAATLLVCSRTVEAKTSSLTYQMLLAVDDPASGAGTPAAPAQPLDNETPAGLQGGEAAPAPVADAEETKAKAPLVEDEEKSVFKTWWFWALTAGIVASTVALGVWAAQPGDTPARICQPGVIACFGDGRN